MTSTATGIVTPPRPRHLAALGWAFLPAVAILATGAASRLGVALCPFRWATGFPCPGCGMTRGIWALLRGDFSGAITAHPLSPFVAVVVAVWWLNGLLGALGRPKLPAVPTAAAKLWWLALAVTLVIWVVRLFAPAPVGFAALGGS